MKLGKLLSGSADFSFDYFVNGGFVGCTCAYCSKDLRISIENYNSGKAVEHIVDDLGKYILGELIERKIVKENNNDKLRSSASKYMFRSMDALFIIVECEDCKTQYLSIFGMGETQPGREQIKYNGIWEVKTCESTCN